MWALCLNRPCFLTIQATSSSAASKGPICDAQIAVGLSVDKSRPIAPRALSRRQSPFLQTLLKRSKRVNEVKVRGGVDLAAAVDRRTNTLRRQRKDPALPWVWQRVSARTKRLHTKSSTNLLSTKPTLSRIWRLPRTTRFPAATLTTSNRLKTRSARERKEVQRESDRSRWTEAAKRRNQWSWLARKRAQLLWEPSKGPP
mmetsp:Transcript_24629/g.30701  ORF Transcript_24629/g.30701 Transcript_24629/m.30701 type:complete len:200 (+) Transcript_24629:2910-3509(+)